MKLFYLFDIIESIRWDLEAAGIKPDKYLLTERDYPATAWCSKCMARTERSYYPHKAFCSKCRTTTLIFTMPPFRALEG